MKGSNHCTVKVRFIAFRSVCHEGELRDTEDVAVYVFDARPPRLFFVARIWENPERKAGGEDVLSYWSLAMPPPLGREGVLKIPTSYLTGLQYQCRYRLSRYHTLDAKPVEVEHLFRPEPIPTKTISPLEILDTTSLSTRRRQARSRQCNHSIVTSNRGRGNSLDDCSHRWGCWSNWIGPGRSLLQLCCRTCSNCQWTKSLVFFVYIPLPILKKPTR